MPKKPSWFSMSGAPWSAPQVPLVAPRPSLLAPQRPVQVRQYMLSFQAKGLKPGETRAITAMPQVPFRGEKLVVAEQDAIVHGLRVGNREQLVLAGGGGIPAAMFSPGASSSASFDTASPAQQIVLTVSRPNGGDVTATLVGVAASDDLSSLPPIVEPANPLVEEALAAKKEEDERYEPGVTIDELRELGWDIEDES